MNHLDQAIKPIADALGDDVALLMNPDAVPDQPGDGDLQPEAILAPIVDALAAGAQQIMLAFVSGLVISATSRFKDVGSSLMARVGTRLESLINRSDKAADRKELEEEVTNAKKATGGEGISDDDLTAAEKAVVEALKARGFSEEKAIEIASKVRGASADLLVAG